jgi:hypothetical protein
MFDSKSLKPLKMLANLFDALLVEKLQIVRRKNKRSKSK